MLHVFSTNRVKLVAHTPTATLKKTEGVHFLRATSLIALSKCVPLFVRLCMQMHIPRASTDII